MDVPLVRRYVCISDAETDLVSLLKNRTRVISIDHLILVGRNETPGLATSEIAGYSQSRLAESVERVERDAMTHIVGLPLVENTWQRYIQRTYHSDTGVISGVATTYETNEAKPRGVGIELVAASGNILSSMMRAYSLPFPKDFKFESR
ncbi:MAG: hypothetical protein ACP5NS_01115 [Candidatus Pacearchaeota archaeon]